MNRWIKQSHDIEPRRPRFGFAGTPTHWVKDDPLATHMLNILNPITPAPERWFCQTIREALPLVRDERLRKAAEAFIRQEGAHSHGHTLATRRLAEQGIDMEPYARLLDRVFDRMLGSDPFGRALKSERAQRAWLKLRLAMVAAAEHLTGVLGHWALNAEQLRDGAVDREMADLFLWHAAEEVEHREVADAMFRHVDGNLLRRTGAALVVFPLFAALGAIGVRRLIEQDGALPYRLRMRDYLRAARQGRVPGPGYLGRAMLRYFAPHHSPLREGSTEQALAILEQLFAGREKNSPPRQPPRPATA